MKIHANFPLKNILFYKIGEKVEIDAPAGKIAYTVVSIQ